MRCEEVSGALLRQVSLEKGLSDDYANQESVLTVPSDKSKFEVLCEKNRRSTYVF